MRPLSEALDDKVYRIVVVDNEPDVGSFITATLNRAGFSTYATTTGRDALYLLANSKSPIALMLIDVVMPGMDGPSLAHAVREIHPDTGIVFMTGYPRDHLDRYGSELLDAQLLKKPFTAEELLNCVKWALGTGTTCLTQDAG